MSGNSKGTNNGYPTAQKTLMGFDDLIRQEAVGVMKQRREEM
jgi:hypothetical protein